MKYPPVVFFVSFVIILFYGCGLLGSGTTGNFSNRKEEVTKHISDKIFSPKVLLFHKNDTISNLYFFLKSESLLYSKDQDKDDYLANILVYTKLISSTDGVVKQDTFNFTDISSKQNKKLQTKIDIKIDTHTTYRLEVVIKDKNKGGTVLKQFSVNKKDTKSWYNFLIVDKEGGVIFDKIIKVDSILLIKRKECNYSQVYFFHFYKERLPANPPYYKKDTGLDATIDYYVFRKTFLRDTMTFGNLTYGRYCLSLESDPNRYKIYGFSKFDNGFPKIKKFRQAIIPLKYILTHEEYAKFSSIKDFDKKRAYYEQLLIEITASKEKARRFIKNYYLRVEAANNYFTGFKEGWKTDRGSIFIVNGSPDKVKTSEEYETWTYVNPRLGPTFFVFKRIPTIFGIDQYVLSPSMSYRIFWQRGVMRWRRTFSS